MQIKVSLDSQPIQRWARLFSKQTLLRAVRVMGPTLIALTSRGRVARSATNQAHASHMLRLIYRPRCAKAHASHCVVKILRGTHTLRRDLHHAFGSATSLWRGFTHPSL